MKIGILGGGQLALMMIESIKDEDIDFIVVDPNENPPASKVVKCIKSEFDDEDTLNMLSEQCDIVTIDFENVPSSSLRFLENKVTVHPNSNAVELCQDRLKEKMLFQECGIPVTNFQKIDNLEELHDISKKFSDDSILKSRFFGYDGKNQVYLKNYTMKEAFAMCGSKNLILEKKVEFTKELSIIGSRSQTGETIFFPLVENVHSNGILNHSIAPFVDSDLQAKAETYHKKLATKMNYVGVLVIEFFLDNNSVLIANEMAPRVHNSGHWTIEGANVSQFEAHIRTIANIPLKNIEIHGFSAMINILSEIPQKLLAEFSDDNGFHDYGKEKRLNRKLAHLTINDDDKSVLLKKLEKVKNII